MVKFDLAVWCKKFNKRFDDFYKEGGKRGGGGGKDPVTRQMKCNVLENHDSQEKNNHFTFHEK